MALLQVIRRTVLLRKFKYRCITTSANRRTNQYQPPPPLLQSTPVIVFDKDGVLLDLSKTWMPVIVAKAEYLVQRAIGGIVTRNELLSAVGVSMDDETSSTGVIHEDGMFAANTFPEMREVWADMEPALKPVFADTVRYESEVRQICLDAAGGSAVAKGNVVQTLEELIGMGHTLAVVTNDTTEMTMLHLKDMGIHSLFSEIVCADSGFGKKPESGGLLRVCAQLGVAPQQATMVGDTVADYAAFVTAGYSQFVAVADCAPSRPDFIPTAAVTVPSIEHLPQLFRA